MAANVAQDS
jgi:predicted phosphodiesterase